MTLAFSALLAAAGEQPVNLGHGFYLERSDDQFGNRCHGIYERTGAASKLYPLPQSTFEKWEKLRLEEAKKFGTVPTRASYERQEVIGPYKVEGSRVWFGNRYYDSEGVTGVGAFGYFDMDTRLYSLFSPPEIAPWEISALLVEPNVVWLGLDHFGEDVSNFPGGLARWDRNTREARRYPLEFLIEHIRRDTRDRSQLVLSTPGGYALFREGQVERFLIRKSENGSQIAIHIDRFPPPPTKY